MLKTNVGQILLTHPKDENYTSLYEESLKKAGKTVQLFVVLEINNETKTVTPELKREYKKIEQEIVSSFKKVYVSTELVNEGAFEKALATVNQTLSRLAGKSKVKWFGRTNVILGAFYDRTLSLSSTGNAQAFLVRDGETSQIAEENIDEKLKPVKIFSTFTSGKLKRGDRVILSTNQIFNYLSMQRVNDFVKGDDLRDVCEDIIEALQDVKNIGFATFVIEVLDAGTVLPAVPVTSEEAPVINSKPQPVTFEKIKSQKALYLVLTTLWVGLKQLGRFIWAALLTLVQIFYRSSKNFSLSSSLQKPKTARKKAIRLGIALALVILIVSVSVAAWNRSIANKQADIESKITEAEKQLNDAEARLIFEDGDRAVELVAQAEKLINDLEGEIPDEQFNELKSRLSEIKQKVEKKVVIDEPTVLAEFPNIPTEILRSPNGILGFNRNSGSLAFFDFRTGQAQEILGSENTSGLLTGGYVGGTHDYVFLNRSGRFLTLDVSQNSLTEYENEVALELDDRKIEGLSVFGSGDAARIYLLDSQKSEILRASVSESGVGQSEQWLTQTADLSNSLDIAVDGNIYVLYESELEQYFRGQKTGFSLAQVLPQLRNAVKIHATAETQFIYILDPSNERVLLFDKEGKLANQFISPKFRDLTDVYPDESTGIAYILSGAELLQIDLE